MIFHMIAGGPKPVAPFSHAVETDGFVFVTGQMPDTPQAAGVLPEGIVAQTHAVMENLKTVLAGIGLSLEHVAMARIYLTRFQVDYAAMNETYSAYFRPTDSRRAPASASPASPTTPASRSTWSAGAPSLLYLRVFRYERGFKSAPRGKVTVRV